MRVTFRVQRYDPKKHPIPVFQSFVVEDVEPRDAVLDVLHRIKWEQDGSLSFRRSCAHGICGSCGMRINDRNMLACSVLLKDLNTRRPVKVQPLPGFPIIRDLVVDQTRFFEKLEVIKPYLVAKSQPPEFERLQSPKDAERLFEAAKCILCACCTSACPITWSNPDWLGPAALLKANRFIFDTRDEGADERLGIIDAPDGVWRCHTVFNCNEVCPKEINITGHLSELKRACTTRNV